MNEPLISVIVPVYKTEKYIEKCINSIVNQTYQKLEIILVDDGSPDGCPAICDMWAAQDPRIRVIHKTNGGLSSARNAGLAVASGEYVAFVDSDDWIAPDYYAMVIGLMQEHHAEIGCAGRYDVDAKTSTKKIGLCPSSTRVISPKYMIKKMLTWDECDSSVCDKVFASLLWKNIRFPEGINNEDVATTYRVVGLASRIIMVSEPLYFYYHREGSITTSVYSSKSMYVVTLADEISEKIACQYPDALPEMKYFKFKTLLHWNREYALQRRPSPAEKKMNRASRAWLIKQFAFVFFSYKRVSLKDKMWYILIVLGMNRIIRWQIG